MDELNPLLNPPLNLPIATLQNDLMDIYIPETVAWWPLAWGWWIILTMMIVMVAVGVRFYRQKTQLRCIALARMDHIEQHYAKHADIHQLVLSIDILIRRILLSQQPPRIDFYPGICGEQWLLLLDKTCSYPAFSQGPGRALIRLAFQTSTGSLTPLSSALGHDNLSEPTLEKMPILEKTEKQRIDELLALVKQWIWDNT